MRKLRSIALLLVLSATAGLCTSCFTPTLPIPPPIVKAIQRWEGQGTEARLETHTILKVSSPAVLEELRKSRAGRFLEESLGPAAVVVKPGAAARVMAALAELGLLAEIAPAEKKAAEPEDPASPPPAQN